MPSRLILAALAALLIAPASAPAATTLGQTSPPSGDPNDLCRGNVGLAQSASDAPGYTVPAPGVITVLRTEGQTLEGNELHVFRPTGNEAYRTLASVPVTPAPGLIAIPVRVAVQPGDVLGLSTGPDDGQNCVIPGSPQRARNLVVGRDQTETPNAGDDVTLADAELGRLNVGATLEPDADGDGFGDETQDKCPDDFSRTTQECAADLVISQVPAESEFENDDVNVLTIVVRNNGSSLARDVRVTEAIPPGVRLIATTPSSGGCAAGAPVDCTFPSVPSGGAASVLVVVKAISTGRKTFTANVGSPTPDPNGFNNSAEIDVEVSARRAVLTPGAFCRVPRLTGLSRTSARRALVAAGCRLGTTRSKRFRSGRFSRVRTQSIPARVRVAAGTRVSITLRRR